MHSESTVLADYNEKEVKKIEEEFDARVKRMEELLITLPEMKKLGVDTANHHLPVSEMGGSSTLYPATRPHNTANFNWAYKILEKNLGLEAVNIYVQYDGEEMKQFRIEQRRMI